MLKIYRISLVLISILLSWVAWYIFPLVFNSDNLKWLSGLMAILSGFQGYLFKILNDVSAVQGLTTKEHERLIFKLKEIRGRIFLTVIFGFLSSIGIWLLGAFELPLLSPFYAACVGFFVGTILSYFLMCFVWIDESQGFVDEVRRQDSLKKKQVEIIKKIKNTDK